MKRLVMAMGLVALFALSGCATVFGGGTHQRLNFDSAPEGATVLMNGQQLGVTPLNVDVSREKNVAITFKKDGYESQSVVLDTHLNPWVWGDVIAGSLLSTTVDTATNSSVKYSEDHYMVTLVANGSSTAAADHRNQVSQFIVTNYAALGAELQGQMSSKPSMQGQHAVALADMLSPAALGDRLPTLLALQDLYRDTHTAADFANAVLSKFSLN